jgi:hypothetical protein
MVNPCRGRQRCKEGGFSALLADNLGQKPVLHVEVETADLFPGLDGGEEKWWWPAMVVYTATREAIRPQPMWGGDWPNGGVHRTGYRIAQLKRKVGR